MVNVEDIVDKTEEKLMKKEKGRKVSKLTKKFFKYPFVVRTAPSFTSLYIERWAPLYGKTVIQIFTPNDEISCREKKFFNKFVEFANVYESEIGVTPSLETDYS